MPGPRPRGLRRGDPALRRLNLAMFAAGLAAFSLLYVTQALLPAIGSTFGVGPAGSSLTVSCATGALAIAILPFSSLAESVGRTRVMTAGLLTATLLAALSAASPYLWVLLILRALVGVALACVVAVAIGHLGDEVHPAESSVAIGLYVSGNTLGGVLGRLIPGTVQDVASWRVAVLALVLCSAIAVLGFILLVPPPRRFQPTPMVARTHLHTLRGLLADPAIRRLCAAAFLLMGGFVAAYNYLGYHLTAAPIRLAPAVASLLFLAYLAGTASSAAAGRLAARFGRRIIVLGAISTSAGGLLLTLSSRLGWITAGLVVFTAGFFAAHSVASGWVAARGVSSRSQASALYLMAYYAGSSALGSLLGVVYRWGGWTAAVAGIVALAVVAVGCLVGVDDVREPAGPQTDPPISGR